VTDVFKKRHSWNTDIISSESEVCRVMVQRNMANQRFGNALEWAIRSRDNVYVTAVADVFLEVS
jgi:nuclear pore complex protein Nup85